LLSTCNQDNPDNSSVGRFNLFQVQIDYIKFSYACNIFGVMMFRH
jgi:hypothetical protein